jgi:hypothetical protein
MVQSLHSSCVSIAGGVVSKRKLRDAVGARPVLQIDGFKQEFFTETASVRETIPNGFWAILCLTFAKTKSENRVYSKVNLGFGAKIIRDL